MADFYGDTTCTTHHACDCLQQKATAYDQLLGDVRDEVERCRREALADRKSSSSRGTDERNLWAALAFERTADRLEQIIGKHDG